MKHIFRNLLIAFVAFVIIAGLFGMYLTPAGQPEQIDLGAFVQKINAGEVREISITENAIIATLSDDKKVATTKESNESLSTQLGNYGVDVEKLRSVKIDIHQDTSLGFWASVILPFAIPFVLVLVLMYVMMRQAQGANNRAISFGQSRPRESNPEDKKNQITFADVAGVKEAKVELLEVVEFLRQPAKFKQLGARIPKGVLLVGPPGTGKTLLARAVAGEAGVPFFSISGSEFVEMFVGVGASRVRDLFRRAKKTTPCIIFIDELDAVGRQRGAGMGGSNDEREQTLNQILVEMDGFDGATDIIIMAATNRPDVLDAALLRPGRFDRRVVIDPPDRADRMEILNVHARNKPMDTDVNFERIAQRTPGFTGADLANLLNEAAILTARRSKHKVGMSEVIESIEKVMLGPERRSHLLSEEEKKMTAYHEAGHALVAHYLPKADPVHKVSIISRGRAGGYTLKLPDRDKHMHTKAEFEADLAMLLGGYVTEKDLFDDLSTGASSDLRHATSIARQIVTQYGMSDLLGARTFGEREELVFLGKEIHERRDYSEKTAEVIDAEISRLIAEAQATAHRLIMEHRDQMDEIAKQLLEKETLEKEEFEAIFAPAGAAPAAAADPVSPVETPKT